MSRIRRAAMATGVAQVFNLVGLFLSFVTVPLYLTWLGSERYGLMLTAQACAGYLAFSDAGLSWSSLLLISHANGRGDRVEIARIIRNSLTLSGVSVMVIILVTVVACTLLKYQSTILPLPASNPESIGLTLAIGWQVIVMLGTSPVYGVLIGLQESHLAGMYQGLGRVLGVAGSLWCAARGKSLGSIVAVGSVGALLTALACAVHIRWRHPWAFARGSFWDGAQIRLQYRTGAKSFGLQIGRTLVSSAPVLAISSQAGASFVPGFTVALTLLNTPLNIVNSFNASLQAGYGEAVGRQDFAWIRATVQAILRNTILLQALLAAGFMTLAGATILLWTHGKLHVTPLLLCSVLTVGLLNSTYGILQFVLSGVNRHKAAGASEVGNGLLCLAFGVLVVRLVGYEWVGFAVLGGALATSAWVLPSQAKKHLTMDRLWPSASFSLAVVLATGISATVGVYVLRVGQAAVPRCQWLPIIVAMPAIIGSYLCAMRIFLPDDADRLFELLKRSGRTRIPAGKP